MSRFEAAEEQDFVTKEPRVSDNNSLPKTGNDFFGSHLEKNLWNRDRQQKNQNFD